MADTETLPGLDPANHGYDGGDTTVWATNSPPWTYSTNNGGVLYVASNGFVGGDYYVQSQVDPQTGAWSGTFTAIGDELLNSRTGYGFGCIAPTEIHTAWAGWTTGRLQAACYVRTDEGIRSNSAGTALTTSGTRTFTVTYDGVDTYTSTYPGAGGTATITLTAAESEDLVREATSLGIVLTRGDWDSNHAMTEAHIISS
jgi:hypothetical protein